MPDLRLVSKADSPLTKTRVLRFEQTKDQVPVFGSRAIVELDASNDLVSISGDFAEVDDVSAIADLSPKEALDRIADRIEVPSDSLSEAAPPDLTFFQDDEDGWHLAYFFRKLPATPREPTDPSAQRPGVGGVNATVNYLVDAHNGEMLAAYSATPTLYVPTKLKGIDEADVGREFWGEKNGADFSMHDPLRKISTYDLQFGDPRAPLPSDPISNPTGDWTDTNKAAVSAQANATHVYDFYKAVLLRDGIDNAGMALTSVVNCVLPATHPPAPKAWHNAWWRDGTMYYGQDDDDSPGTFRSWSRFLDVIAHELTHGVTESASELIYEGETGALNESFSDIFGVIIHNWYAVGPDSDVVGWDWEIGYGIRGNGTPLRDFSDPRRIGQPDHMDDFVDLPNDSDNDWGGVHRNSGIHNKAAFNVLTSVDDNGDLVFEPREVAILYYLTLTRLSSIATFVQTLQELIQVASTMFAGDAEERAKKTTAIEDAYNQVGIVV